MKSTWVAAGLLLVTVCQTANTAFSNPSSTPTTTALPVNFTIKDISRGESNMFTVCLNEYEPDANIYQLIPNKDGKHEDDLAIDAPTTVGECLKFSASYDINTWSGSNLTLILHALIDKEIKGTTVMYINPFPEFPQPPLKAFRVPDPNGRNNAFMSRISGDMKDMTEIKELSGKVPIISDDGNIKYYLDVLGTDPNYTPCATSIVPICDVPLVVATPKPLPVLVGPTVGKAVLSYGYTLDAEPVSAKITVKATSASTDTASDKLEVIFQKDGANAAKLCAFKSFDEASCEVTWTHSEEKATIRVIGVLSTSNEIQETDITQITDRNVGITSFEGIVEGNWVMPEEQKNKNYKITKKNIDDSPEVDEDIDVDCTSISISLLCFGYFSTVTKSKKYTITVRNVMGGTSTEEDQIESEPVVAIKEISSQDLQIHDLPMERHQNHMEANTTICFSHETSNEEMIFSHYEMLLINTRGQWLKHKVMEEDDNGDVLCFTPFTINTQEFDVTEGVKVVVSQRASDGFSVIASGGSTLF